MPRRLLAGWLAVALVEEGDRITHFHLKDWSGQPPGPGVDRSSTTRDVGQGVIDFRRIFQAIRKPDKYWYVVEREGSPDPTQTARNAYEYLSTLTD